MGDCIVLVSCTCVPIYMSNNNVALWILNNCQDTYTLRNKKIIVTCYLFYKNNRACGVYSHILAMYYTTDIHIYRSQTSKNYGFCFSQIAILCFAIFSFRYVWHINFPFSAERVPNARDINFIFVEMYELSFGICVKCRYVCAS